MTENLKCSYYLFFMNYSVLGILKFLYSQHAPKRMMAHCCPVCVSATSMLALQNDKTPPNIKVMQRLLYDFIDFCCCSGACCMVRFLLLSDTADILCEEFWVRHSEVNEATEHMHPPSCPMSELNATAFSFV